jgi:hypothetical protein
VGAHIYKQWEPTSNSPENTHLTAVGAFLSQHQMRRATTTGNNRSSHLATTGAIAAKHHKRLRQKAHHQTSQTQWRHKWRLPYLTLDCRTLPTLFTFCTPVSFGFFHNLSPLLFYLFSLLAILFSSFIIFC